ncbi:MAG: ATP-binding cassette domain-containing protein, partial [Rhodospirillales bacterium]|nr:ATP-binding cassette domain-containing protein [Rhodospirillales bacterium]
MIEIKDLRVTFGRGTPMETTALRGVSLDIPTGQFVTVIGSNGAGKTTLLNVLSGETALDSGQVVIDGTDVTRWPTHKRADLVARVFQDPMTGSCANLTIAENLGL